MKVKDLVQLLVDVDQELEVYVESDPHIATKTKGVFLVFTPVEVENVPKNCIVVETQYQKN